LEDHKAHFIAHQICTHLLLAQHTAAL